MYIPWVCVCLWGSSAKSSHPEVARAVLGEDGEGLPHYVVLQQAPIAQVHHPWILLDGNVSLNGGHSANAF